MVGDDVSWDGDEWWAKIARPTSKPVAGKAYDDCFCPECERSRILIKGAGDLPTATAMKLLVTHLTPLELECFTKHRYVPVTDSEGWLWALWYENAPSSSAELIGYGRLCWYPGLDEEGNYLPKGDVVLGQKLALETGAYERWLTRGYSVAGKRPRGFTKELQDAYLSKEERGGSPIRRYWK